MLPLHPFRYPYNDVSRPFTDKKPILRMKEDEIIVDFGVSSPHTFTYRQANGEVYTINDGQWYYVLVAYDDVANKLVVYINNVKVVEETVANGLLFE